MDGGYLSYLDSVTSRLKDDGFELQSRVSVGGIIFDLIGRKKRSRIQTPQNTFVSLVSVSGGGTDSIEPSMKAVTDLIDSTPDLAKHSLFVFPVVASPAFDASLKERVRTYKMMHVKLSGYDAPTSLLHPVLVELQTRQIFHYEKSGFVGWSLLRNARKFAEEYFGFE